MRGDRSRAMQLNDVLHGLGEPIRSEVNSTPNPKVFECYSHYAHSAVFADVRLDEELGMLRVKRVVSGRGRPYTEPEDCKEFRSWEPWLAASAWRFMKRR